MREGQSVHPVNTDSEGFFKEGLDRFLDEAKQLIRFRTHPSIVSCRDFFRANGTAYLVMDLEEGMSLSELLQAREAEGRPFDETDLFTVMVPLLEGLDLVHAAGVLHRDIKPANILIRREDNRPVLIDFGAAKQEFAQHSKSLAPFSPGYAAIEQVAEGRLGTWTDMYGIGAVMWRMMAGGNRPYEPLHPVRVERRAHARFRGEPDPMPSAQTLGKGRFSQHILAAIDQCLELRETDRMQGCKELLQRLREAGRPAPGIAEPTAKERQPAGQQPIPRTAPNAKEQRAKTGSVKRGSSGNKKVARVVQKPPNKRRIRRALHVVVLFLYLVAIIGLFAWPSIMSIVVPQSFTSGSPASDFEVLSHQSLPDTLNIAIMADKGSVAPIRVTVDDDLRRPYWIDHGGSMTFRMTDRIILEQQLDNVTVQVEGITYPVSRPAGEDRVILTRDALSSWFSSTYSANSSVTGNTSAGAANNASPGAAGSTSGNRPEFRSIPSNTTRNTNPDAIDSVNSNVTSNADPNVTSGALQREESDPVLQGQGQIQVGQTVNFFTRGSHADDVLRIQGTPTAINTYGALGKETWRYGYSTIEISLPGRRVIDWDNSQSNLKVQMQPGRNVTSTSFFTRGSHADDVLRIQGTPTAINTYEALGKETWRYGYSTVEISLPGRRVIDWDNSQSNLKVQMQPGRNVTSTSFFTRGSHADDVLRIQGTPTAINTYEALGKETWRYGYSTVEISLPGRRVIDWDNSQSNLKVQMQPGRNVTSTSFFTRGSHADDVLRIQGTPTAINTYEALGKETWRYGYSTVEISLPDRRVIDWGNSQNNLKVQMQPGTTR